MIKKMGRMMGKSAKAGRSMMDGEKAPSEAPKPRGMIGRAMSRAMPGLRAAGVAKAEEETPQGRGLMKRIGRAMAGKRMAFKEGGMADKKGRAMKKTDADAMGRAMKSKAKPKKKMGGGMMKKGY